MIAPFALRHGVNVRTIHHLHAARFPERVAMVDERSSLTYAEANAAINRICHAFASQGLRRGDRVVLCMENRVEYLLFWFASLRAGIAAVHASYRSTSAELLYLTRHSAARAIVCSERTGPAVGEVCAELHALEVIVVGDAAVHPRQHRYETWAARHPDTFYAIPRDVPGSSIVYTSGTTGKPKGAVRDFAKTGIGELSRITERLPVEAGDRHLVVCPLYHSGAQAFVGIMSSLGCTIVLRRHFDAVDTLETLSRWRIHSVFLVPTMIRRITELPAEQRAAHPTPALRAVVSGAAEFPHALRERAIELFGPQKVFDFYGATELGWLTLIRGDEMLAHPGSVGCALSGHELRVTDADRRPLATGEVGTIWARNDQTMEGYLHDQVATDASHDHGWVTVDDLGYLDRDGYLYLCGRDRDMVISGGVNIYPVEIEEVLAGHPEVVEVAVIGIADDDLGERLVAVVVGDVGVDALDTHARASLAAHKVPRRWEFVDELPRNPTGKVLKRELRERFSAPRTPGQA